MTDYRALVNGHGGSKPGSEKRRCPDALKLAALRWHTAKVCGGDETVAWNQNGPRRVSRFGPAAIRPVIPLLRQYLPEESASYMDDRRDPKPPEEWLDDRIHKCYYTNNGSTKVRAGKSREHPDNWPHARRARAEARLVEVGWPW